MSVVRHRGRGARYASFGFGLCLFALLPNEIGYQDIGSFLAREDGAAGRWQRQVSSAAASIQLATYSLARPIGTSAPESIAYSLASLPRHGEVTGALRRNLMLQLAPSYQVSDFPGVERALKGDSLMMTQRARQLAAPAGNAPPPLGDPPAADRSIADIAALPLGGGAKLDAELKEALGAPPLAQYEQARPLDDPNTAPDTVEGEQPAFPADGFDVKTARLYFGTASLGGSFENLKPYQSGEEPLVDNLRPDPDVKATLPLSGETGNQGESGESIAPKGQVNRGNRHKETPAERLGLFDAKSRAKAEKCLAEAVYFEARAEAVRGQIAVAQVVMNRAFSGYYPATVCGVVYQNQYRHFACQFSFACANNLDVIREPDMWERAEKIAKAMLDGLIFLPEVGKSTHYRAYYVHPSWVSEMKRMYKFGVHTFYRPKAWGDGDDAPSWGTPQQTAAISAALGKEAKSEAELYPNSLRR